MANSEHVAVLERGVAEWNEWRVTNRVDIPDLSDADLKGRFLFDINLSDADLRGANLTGANLLRGDLRGANLRYALLRGTALRGANLTGSVFGNTTLAYSDLSEAKGLETVRHVGPSSIGLDTFFEANGLIPETFLRGAGLPDIFIQYAASLAGKPLDFFSSFISHSTKDREFVERLYADLQNKGVRCWYAPIDLKIGDKTRVEIDEAIRVYDKLLVILSKNSVQSEWVEKEVEAAFEMERNQKRVVLFPIRVDAAVMDVESGWPADIRRTRHIGDFCEWKDHDAYAKAFARLLSDLKNKTRVPGGH